MTIKNVIDFIKNYTENHPEEDFIQPILYLQDMGINMNAYYDNVETGFNGQYFKLEDGVYKIPFNDMNTDELDLDEIKKCNIDDIQSVIINIESTMKEFKKFIEE